jgi:sec-independent protein translocase protein TatB
MLPEVGGVEVLAIAALALIIIGPKDLPVMLRKLGKFVGKMRAMANEFRASFDELARQSELDELRKEVEAMRLAQTYDPTGLVPGAYGPQEEAEPSPSPSPSPGYEPAPEQATKPKKARAPKAAARASKPRAKPAPKPASKRAVAKPRKPKAAS